jgi:hypothetical protein
MSKTILLLGGTILVHDQDDHPIPYQKDVVIEGDIITKIEEKVKLELYPDAVVIDCKDRIISPGFIDTHHHLWQTQLTGRHGDHSLVDYMATGKLICIIESQLVFDDLQETWPRSSSHPKIYSGASLEELCKRWMAVRRRWLIMHT